MPRSALSESSANRVLLGSMALLLCSVVGCLFLARHWPLVQDAPLIHYVVFLMQHGRTPYRDIIEINMPGSYMVDFLEMKLLGTGVGGVLAWEALTVGAAILGGAWIAGKGYRFAGVSGACLAYIFHMKLGSANLGQRDWTVAILLLLGFGFLFEALRKEQPAWLAGFALCCGVAATIKPLVAIVPVFYLVVACWMEWRHGRSIGPTVLWSCCGALVPVMGMALFLRHWGVWKEFHDLLTGLLPYYASLLTVAFGRLVQYSRRVLLLFLVAASLFAINRSWRSWESLFLMGGALFGAMFYFIQRKGWEYHLGPMVVFLFIWLFIEAQKGLRRSGFVPVIAAIVLMVSTLVLPPLYLWSATHHDYPMNTLNHLQSDLTRLGGQQLSGEVQCLDMTRGSCINVLYRMKLVQTTGSVYDFYLFPEVENKTTLALQQRVLQELVAHLPKVLILSSEEFAPTGDTYDQIKLWPGFEQLLEAHYRMETEFLKPNEMAGYRIYVLRP